MEDPDNCAGMEDQAHKKEYVPQTQHVHSQLITISCSRLTLLLHPWLTEHHHEVIKTES